MSYAQIAAVIAPLPMPTTSKSTVLSQCIKHHLKFQDKIKVQMELWLFDQTGNQGIFRDTIDGFQLREVLNL